MFFPYKVGVLIASIIALCSKVSAEPISIKEPVGFLFGDYANLGDLKKASFPSVQQLTKANTDLAVNVKYVENVMVNIAAAGAMTGTNSIPAELLDGLEQFAQIQGAANASSAVELAATFSSLNLTKLKSVLETTNSILSSLESSLSEPIEPPSNKLFEALAVSASARVLATQSRDDAVKFRDVLTASKQSIESTLGKLDILSSNVEKAIKVAIEVGRILEKFPILDLASRSIVEQLRIEVITAEAQFRDLLILVSKLRALASASLETVNDRKEETSLLVASLNQALDHPTLPSFWNTSANLGRTDGSYSASFTGENFESKFAEIEGEFWLGRLFITNLLYTGSNDYFSNTIEFTVERRIYGITNDPVYTPAYVALTTIYENTINSSDVRSSADLFKIPSLGVALGINEGATAEFILKGRYDSPLRVSSVEFVGGGGFITPLPGFPSTPPATSVPEPLLSRIGNVSIRTTLAARQLLIVGLTMSGGEKPVLVRAAGPGLGTFGVNNFMPDPELALFDGSQRIAGNDNWGGGPQLVNAMAAVGAFPLPPSGKDAAILTPLSGGRTIQVQGSEGGNVLVEAYDAGSGNSPRLTNVSARNLAGSGGDILIAGFSVSGNTSKTVLIRAIGPTLAAFGLTSVLSDPKLEVYSSDRKVAENDDWASSLAPAFASVGAFPLTAGGKDSAIRLTLLPGGYTVHVTAATGGSGEALLEIYEVP